MWCQSGQNPDAFWHQTPLHFQILMRGVRKRLKVEADDRLAQAWHTGAFTGATQSKRGLKPLPHYLREKKANTNPGDVIAALKTWKAAGAQISLRRVPIAKYEVN